MPEFIGAKIALLCGDRLIAYKRDDKPEIPFPGFWDLPGGGREGEETAIDCALRELEEAFALRLPPDRVHWCRAYPEAAPGMPVAYFMVGAVEPHEVAAIRFGDEGERWEMMLVEAFLRHPDGVPHLQSRLRDYLDSL